MSYLFIAPTTRCDEPARTKGSQRASFRPRLRGGGVSRQENLGFVALKGNKDSSPEVVRADKTGGEAKAEKPYKLSKGQHKVSFGFYCAYYGGSEPAFVKPSNFDL